MFEGMVEATAIFAQVAGKVLGKPIVFEQMEMMEFIKLLGFENEKMKKHHFQSVRIDQQEGLLRGTDDIGTRIIGRPLMTIEEFINENRPDSTPKSLEASGGDACVVNGVLGIGMPKVILDQAQVVAAVGEREAAGVPQHVRMYWQQPGPRGRLGDETMR